MKRRSAGELRRQDILEDLYNQVPEITEDFHHPCPKCGAEATILATQEIRRTRCPGCGQELTLDKRIGGQLCLLPCNTQAEEESRRDVERFRARWLKVLTLGIALLIVIGLGFFALTRGSFTIFFVGALLVGAYSRWQIVRDHSRKPRSSRRRRRRRRGRPGAPRRRSY